MIILIFLIFTYVHRSRNNYYLFSFHDRVNPDSDVSLRQAPASSQSTIASTGSDWTNKHHDKYSPCVN